MVEKTVWQDEKDFMLVKNEVYKGRAGKPFATEGELKKAIKSAWKICANDLVSIKKAIKQFVARFKAVEEKQGMDNKMKFS